MYIYVSIQISILILLCMTHKHFYGYFFSIILTSFLRTVEQTTRKKCALSAVADFATTKAHNAPLLFLFDWDDLAALLAGVFPGVTWRPCGRTRVGRVPTSYPIASTRRLMGLTANARTDRMVYVDCREDCLNYNSNILKLH